MSSDGSFMAGFNQQCFSGQDEEKGENKNTKRKTETDMRIFRAYLVSLNEMREPETIPPSEMDNHLATYFSIIKKHDGNEYEPASLRGMLCSIERYLRCRNYPVSLTRDSDFINTRSMLKEKQKVLREMAKTETLEKDISISNMAVHRLKQLYLAKEFGPYNASSVINALCFSFAIHLKIKKAIDHKQLLWGDIELTTIDDKECLFYNPLVGYEYCRMPLKGISGCRITTRCQSLWNPIAIYKLYRSKRPVSMLSPASPFYLGVAMTSLERDQYSWYKPIALGVNKLNDLMRMIRDITGSVSLPKNPTFSIDMALSEYPVFSPAVNNNSTDVTNNTQQSGYCDVRQASQTKADDNTDEIDDRVSVSCDAPPSVEANLDVDEAVDETETEPVDLNTSNTSPSSAQQSEDQVTQRELPFDGSHSYGADIEAVKAEIASAMTSLDTRAHQDIVRWMREKFDGIDAEPNEVNRRLAVTVSFKLQGKQLDCGGEPINAKVSTEWEDATPLKKSYKTDHPVKSPGESRNAPRAFITPLKRAISYPCDTGSRKQRRMEISQQDVSHLSLQESASLSSTTETSANVDNTMSVPLISASANDAAVPLPLPLPSPGFLTNCVPYGPWAYDSNVTRFLCEKLRQTYDDMTTPCNLSSSSQTNENQ